MPILLRSQKVIVARFNLLLDISLLLVFSFCSTSIRAGLTVTIWTKKTKVAQSVILVIAIFVVQLQREWFAIPFTEIALVAFLFQQALVQQSDFQAAAICVSRIRHQNCF